MENRKQMDIIIGNNMAAIRKSREYKQREICQVLGMNASTYKHYELGDRCVPPSVLKALANNKQLVELEYAKKWDEYVHRK